MPTSDHVPLEMNAAESSSGRGVATTADAVSCEATLTTGVDADSPHASATCGSSPPRTVPPGTIGGKIRKGSPRSSMSSRDQSPVRASRSCVVLAFVTSATRSPVSQYPSRSGMSSIVSASSSRSSASSWKRVLMGSSWMPVMS